MGIYIYIYMIGKFGLGTTVMKIGDTKLCLDVLPRSLIGDKVGWCSCAGRENLRGFSLFFPFKYLLFLFESW